MKHIIPSESLQYLFREKKNNGAEFTAKSRITGKEYTFSVSRSKFKDRWYTHLYVEQEYQNYIRLGTYANGRITNNREEVKTPSALAIRYIMRLVVEKRFVELDSTTELMHTGSCLVCGKTLTDSESITHGIGPVCRNL